MKYRVFAALLIQILLLGCIMDPQEGEVKITFSHGERSLWSIPEENMEISAYDITLTGPSGEHTVTHDTGEGSFFLKPLVPGSWTVDIDGRNSSGDVVAVQDEQVQVYVRRGRVSEVEVLLVPVTEGTSSLSVRLDWSDVNDQLIASYPNMRIAMESHNSMLQRYPKHEGTSTINYEGNASGSAELTDGFLNLDLETSSDLQELDFSGLPPGLYRITLGLYASSGDRYWQGMWFAYLVPYGDPVSGTVTVLDEELETGSLDLSVVNAMNPPLDFEILADAVTAGVPAEFSLDGYEPSEDAEFIWYVNGDEVSCRGDGTMVHTFEHPGNYSIALSLFDNGAWGSAVYEADVTEEL